MPNTFPIRNLIPESPNHLVSHSMCLRGCLIDKYSSFTRIFVCLVKQTSDSDYFQNPFSKQIIFFSKEKTRGIAANEDWRWKTQVLTLFNKNLSVYQWKFIDLILPHALCLA